MSVTVTNLTQGPGAMYFGAFGATEPLDSALASIPSAGAWTDLGGTAGGVSLTIDQTYKELEVDQIVDIAEQRLVRRVMTIVTVLAEPTLENLALAMNIAPPTTGTGTKTLEPSDDSSATQPLYKALIFDGYAPGGPFKRRVIGRKCLQTDKVTFAYKKDDASNYTVTFTCHYVSSVIKPFKIIDATV